MLRVLYLAAAMFLGSITFSDAITHSQPVPQLPPASQALLAKFLQNYLKGPFGQEYQPTRFYPAAVPLTPGPSPQIVVYVTGPHWCGGGGCTLLIVAPMGASFQVISKTIGVQLPVTLLPSTSSGWHDLAVGSREGPKLLSFNGRKYPINAYSFPSRRLPANAAGRVAIPSAAAGVPLYD